MSGIFINIKIMIEIRKGVYLFIDDDKDYPIELITIPRGLEIVIGDYEKMSRLGDKVRLKKGLDYYRVAVDLECTNYFGVLEYKDPVFVKSREDYKYLTGEEWKFQAYIMR
jgi:hypothetical protein